MTRQELLDKIARYEKGLTNSQLGDGIKAKMRNDIEKLRAELSEMDMKGDDKPKEEKKGAEQPSSSSKFSNTSFEELESDIEDLKEGLKNPRMDASLKEKFKKQLAELEAEMSRRKSVKKTSAKPKPEKKAAAEKKPKPKAVTQKRAAQVKKQVKEAKKEVEVEKKAGKRGRPKKVVSAPKEAPKKVVKKRATKEVAKKIVKKVAAPKPAPKPVVKAAPKKPAKKKVTKEVAKKSVVVKAKPVVKVKKAEKKPVTKRKTKAEVKSQMPRGLSTFIKGDKEIRERYKGSTHDLAKDAKRGAKPFGWRLAGSNRRPTKADIKEGRAYWENRPERADVRRKEYPKLADGGMMARGGSTKTYKEVKKDKLKDINDEITTLNTYLKKLENENSEEAYKASENLRKYKSILEAKKLNLEDKMASGGMMADGGEISIFEKKIKDALKVENKWHFFNEEVDGKTVQLKMYVGKKEVDVQIFRINGRGANMPRNYVGKRDTLKMIMENFEAKMASGGMMADGGMSEMSEYEEAKQYLEFYHDAKIEREKDGVGYRVNYVHEGMENGGDSDEYLENASKEEIIGLAKKFGFQYEQTED